MGKIPVRQVAYIVLAACIACLIPAIGRSELAPEDIARGATVRSQVVGSGKIIYRLRSGLASADEVWRDNDYKLSFEGESYAKISEGGALINHKGAGISYVKHPQPNGEVHHDLTVGNGGRSLMERFPAPPVFAGSFWHESMAAHVAKHAAGARRIKGDTINGVECEVIEVPVPPTELEGFGGHNDKMERGGALRLWVAPTLGYVLPRVECCDLQGTAWVTYEASGFEQYTPGIFLPNLCLMQHIEPNGSKAYYCRYDIQEWRCINEPLPDGSFSIEVPEGTNVHDRRGAGARYILSSSSAHSSVGDWVTVEPKPWTIWDVIQVGIAIGVVGGLATLFIMARRAIHKKEN